MTQGKPLTFKEIRNINRTFHLRLSEIPVEHVVSLPLPTMRWGIFGYAAFASNITRIPGKVVEQDPPDRWWVINAYNGKLIIYSLYEAVSFSQDIIRTPVLISRDKLSINELEERLDTIEMLIDVLASDFSAHEAGDPKHRSVLLSALNDYLPKSIVPQYRSLTPDFFAWLEA
jgi:hypothetical protein